MDIEEDWMEESEDEIAMRNEMASKLDALLEKTKIIIEENEKINPVNHSVKHVRFKTVVVTQIVTRLPKDLWYSYQEYIEMRKE